MSYSTMRSQLDSASYAARLRGSENFPSPWLDYASVSMPDDIRTIMKMCEFIMASANGTYRRAVERRVAYFLTEVEIGATTPQEKLGQDEKDKWGAFLRDDLGVLAVEKRLDMDKETYGNAFATLHIPFKRFLVCPKCHLQPTLREVHDHREFQYKWDAAQLEFHASCPKCQHRGAWRIKDEPQTQPEKLRIKQWSPHEIHLLHDVFSDEVAFLWKIPEDYKRQIRQGNLFHLERCPREVLKAIRTNRVFRFDPGVMFHMKEPALGGQLNRGWGIPRLLSNFRQAWYVQVLKRYNEAIALDYVIPFRLITPAARPGAGGGVNDPLMNSNMGDFMSSVRRMIAKRRRDPAGWNTLAFPVEYQALGGDATQLAPRELLDQGMEELLTASGTPVELYKGTLQLQTAPVSMRLFEAAEYHLVYDNNCFLEWVVERVSEVLSWERVQARHKRVTHADDMQRHMALLQLMMGGVVSKTTGLKALGIDLPDELRLMADEAKSEQQVQTEIQEEMEQEAFGKQVAMGMPPGGQPPAGGAAPQPGAPPVDPMTGMPPGPITQMVSSGNTPQRPDDMLAQADSLAQQLLGLPEGQKDSELQTLRQKNEVLHSLVRAKLDKIRSQARSQGGQMLMSQQFGG